MSDNATRYSKYLLVPVSIFALLILTAFSFTQSTRQAAAENCQFFAETGFKVCDRFLEYWRNNGGLAQQGLPISEVFDELNAPPPAGDGKVHKVQYFERARFEYHSEQSQPDVLLGLLGTEQFVPHSPAPSSQVISEVGECQSFAETGFKICGRFLEYWRNNGGLAQQGYPISNSFTEYNSAPPQGDGKPHLVQYFQRARFEQHPELSAPYDVLLGLLGTSQFQTKYGAKPVGTLPPPPRVGPPPSPKT